MITLNCSCGKKVRVKASSAGKSVRCPSCEELLKIPGDEPSSSPRRERTSEVAPATAREPRQSRPRAGGPAVIILGVIAAASIAGNVLLFARAGGDGAERSGGASAANEDLRRLEQLVDQKDAEITRLGLESIDRKGKLASQQREVENRDRRIRELEVQVAELEIANTNLEHQARKVGASGGGGLGDAAGGGLAVAFEEPADVELSVLRVRAGRGVGSTGFFVDSNGQFLTCYHPIAGAPEVKATYLAEYKGQRQQVELTCEVLAVDEANDLALLRAPVRYPVAPLLFESEEPLKLGDPIAILDGSVLGVMFSGFRTEHGMVQSLTHDLGGASVVRTTSSVPAGEDGAAIINSRGRVVAIVTESEQGSLGALAIPVAHAATLVAEKDGRFKVEKELASWEAEKAVADEYAGARRIPLAGDVLSLHLVEEGGVAYALERRSRSLLELDLVEGTVKRSMELLSEPASMTFEDDEKSLWVTYAARKSLHQIERKTLTTMQTLQVDFAASRILPFPGILCCLDTSGAMWIVVTKTGEHIKTHLTAIDMERDDHKGRLLLSHYRGIFRVDPVSYAEASLRIQALKKETQYPSTTKKIGQLQEHLQGGCVRHYPIELPDGARTVRSYMLIDDENDRIYYQHAAIDRGDRQSVVGTFPKEPHSLAENETIKSFLALHKDLDRFLAASPDGRFVADGTHLYDARLFQVLRELPTPVAAMAFTADSKILWLHDEHLGSLIGYPVE